MNDHHRLIVESLGWAILATGLSIAAVLIGISVLVKAL